MSSTLSKQAGLGWNEFQQSGEWLDAWYARNRDVAAPRWFRKGISDLVAAVGREPVIEGDLRWHISISRPDRMPTWGELVDAAHELRPGVVFVVGVPPRSWWMNVHPYCLHLWQTSDAHLVAEFRSNAQGDTPT